MAIRDYWVYQKRDTVSPWALYIVKEFDRRAGAVATLIDYTIYSEDIGNATHSKSFVGLHFDTVSGYVDSIVCELSEVSQVDSQDMEQLRTAIERILFD